MYILGKYTLQILNVDCHECYFHMYNVIHIIIILFSMVSFELYLYTHFLQFRYLVLSLQGHENEYELRIK